MKYQDIFDELIANGKNMVIFDAWSPIGSARRCSMLKEVKDEVYRGIHFHIEFRKGGGAGMGAYPDTVRVYLLHNFDGDTHEKN